MSLPAWECGLKQLHGEGHQQRRRSLPAWECGLKRGIAAMGVRELCQQVVRQYQPNVNIAAMGVRELFHSPRGSVD